MDRRRFLLTTLAGAFATPLAAEAQQAGKVYRIGVLLPLGVTPPILASFLAGMRDRGWVENQGFVAEPRYAEGMAGGACSGAHPPGRPALVAGWCSGRRGRRWGTESVA